MVVGSFFILLGIFIILEDIFDVKALIKARLFVKREDFIVDMYYEIKVILGIFSIIVGSIRLLHDIYY